MALSALQEQEYLLRGKMWLTLTIYWNYDDKDPLVLEVKKDGAWSISNGIMKIIHSTTYPTKSTCIPLTSIKYYTFEEQ